MAEDLLSPASAADADGLPDDKDSHAIILAAKAPEPRRPEEKSPLDELDRIGRIPNLAAQAKKKLSKKRRFVRALQKSKLAQATRAQMAARKAALTAARSSKAAAAAAKAASKAAAKRIKAVPPAAAAKACVPDAAFPAAGLAAVPGGPEPLIDFEAALLLLPRLSEASKEQIKMLPAECMPTALGMGGANYTLKAHDGGTVCEIQLQNCCFRLKKTVYV